MLVRAKLRPRPSIHIDQSVRLPVIFRMCLQKFPRFKICSARMPGMRYESHRFRHIRIDHFSFH